MYVSVTAQPFGSSCAAEPAVDAAHFDKLLRWQGKCSYLDVLLEPGQEEDLPFHVVINEEGLFNLNRFAVKVRSAATAAASGTLAAAAASRASPAGPATPISSSAVCEKAIWQQSLVSVSGVAQ